MSHAKRAGEEKETERIEMPVKISGLNLVRVKKTPRGVVVLLWSVSSLIHAVWSIKNVQAPPPRIKSGAGSLVPPPASRGRMKEGDGTT
jgi:hypothetical protein